MGRIPQEESNSVTLYGIAYLRPYHLEIARRLVLGQRASQISELLGMSQSRLSIIINSPLFKLELHRLESERDRGVTDVTKTLRELSPLALETVERTMYGAKSESLRFSAAESILDRAGFGKINKMAIHGEINHNYSNLSDEELRDLARQRFSRMVTDENQKAEDIEKANAIDVTFDILGEDCSEVEQKGGDVSA